MAPLRIANVDLALRPATAADRAFLWHLHRVTMRPYVEATWGWDEADQRRRFDAGFDPRRKRVVLLGGTPVGVLEVERRADALVLAVLEIAPAYQGRGVGTRLIRAVVAEAGPLPVTLRVLRANPARGLYERLGFAVTGTSPTHHTMRREGTEQGRRAGNISQ